MYQIIWYESISRYCKLLTKVQTSFGYAENWTSRGPLELCGPSALATLESLVGLLKSKLVPIFWKSESESDPNATWCTATKWRTIKENPTAEDCSDAPRSLKPWLQLVNGKKPKPKQKPQKLSVQHLQRERS